MRARPIRSCIVRGRPDTHTVLPGLKSVVVFCKTVLQTDSLGRRLDCSGEIWKDWQCEW